MITRTFLLLSLFLIASKSHCAKEQAPNRETLIREYRDFINCVQRFEQTRPKGGVLEESLKESNKEMAKQATREFERLTNKKILTEKELIESHKLLQDLWS